MFGEIDSNKLKNISCGAFVCDAAVLVINASPGRFEIGYSKEGMSFDECMICYTFGVRRFIAVVNQMDNTQYSEARFNEIRAELMSFFKKIGVKTECVAVIPMAAYHNVNLLTPSEDKMPWYKGWETKFRMPGNEQVNTTGMTLLDALDGLPPLIRHEDRPMRMPIQQVHRIGGIGTVVVGKVVQGKLEIGKNYIIQPQGIQCVARSVEVYFGDCFWIYSDSDIVECIFFEKSSRK